MALERELDGARPRGHVGAMPGLVQRGAVPTDFVGIVGELVMVTDQRKAQCLSHLLGRKAGFLVVVTEQSRRQLKNVRATFNLESMGRYNPRELPHRQQNNLKQSAQHRSHQNPQGWTPGALRVLGGSAANAQAKLELFTRVLSFPLLEENLLHFYPPPRTNC